MDNDKVIGKYGLIQNVIFTFSNVWRWDRTFFIGFIPKIFLGVLSPLVVIYFPMLLIDMITHQSSRSEVLLLISVFCLVFTMFELVSVFSDAKIGSMSDIFRNRYNDLCEKKYKEMDYQNTENTRINDLYNRAQESTYDAENMVDNLSKFFINLFGIASFGSIIVIFSPVIMLPLLACVVINYYLFKIVRTYTNKNWKKWAIVDRRCNYLFSITHSYEKIKDIKLYPYPSLISSVMSCCHKERLYWQRKLWKKETIPTLGDAVLATLRNGIVYYILLWQFINGYIDIGLFVFYFGAITGFSAWLNALSEQFSDILRISDEINFIRSFLELEDKFNRTAKFDEQSQDLHHYIELKNVTFGYHPDEKIIKNLSLKIRKGERIALVGHNGAGKTTLIKLICGLYYPDDGEILINGKSVKKIHIEEYYKQFSVMFQEFHLMPITVAQFVSGNGVDVDREKVQACLERAGLYDRVQKSLHGMDTTFFKDVYEDDPGMDLSGGEKQKLLLARALYKNAPILILDEPTAALDPIAENQTYLKFADLTQKKTAIYISHRLASTRFCDTIMLLENGQIIECGTHEQLMSYKGKYYEMFKIQSHYYTRGNI